MSGHRPVGHQRHHRHYRGLLAICMGLMGCMALPFPWSRLASIGYFFFGVALIRGLGQPPAQAGVGVWPRRLYQLLGVAALAVWLLWSLTPVAMRSTGIPVIVLWALFSGWSAKRLILLLSRERQINGLVLSGALAGYLMLGLSAGLLFCALETIHPGSFSGVQIQPPGPNSIMAVWGQDFVRLNYFAFVTLTTTGYGDVVPKTPLAQMASVSVAVIGTLYVAVVMGLLISRLMLREARQHDDAPNP
jgi:voltage-gated potassium channel